MNANWRMAWGFSALGHLPGKVPWLLAPGVGHVDRAQRLAARAFLERRFSDVFPGRAPVVYRDWARAHLAMLACEMVDSVALHRLAQPGGPQVDLQGWEHVEQLRRENKGFLLVLNHFDRLLTGVIVLARQGMRINHITMPIFGNADLDKIHRAFLLRKIDDFVRVIGGQWRTTEDSLRPVIQSLRNGGVWVILADAWRPEFRNLRPHSFLGGMLNLPTGIERIARLAQVPLLHVITHTDKPWRLRVLVERLPDNPVQAIDTAIQKLEQDVIARPWAWWHWGLWDCMWQPQAAAREFHGKLADGQPY